MDQIKVLNPYGDLEISTVDLNSEDEAFAAIETAFQLHKSAPQGLPKHKRMEILENFHSLLTQHQEELIALSTQEGGKPFNDTVVEMKRALNGVKLGITAVQNIAGKEIPMGFTPASEGRLAFTQKSPIGVVLSISAFNHPINLAIHQIVPAIAAGCPVIYKPALTTPLVSKRMVDLLYEAGLPENWCQYIICSNEITAKLCADKRLGYVSFIGSSKVGWDIKSKLAPGVHIALEHGGTAPIIVAEDANLCKAIPAIAKAGLYHAGQVCVSAQRVYVHKNIVDSFIAQLNTEAQKQKVGDPLEETTEIGPIISSEALNRIDDWVKEAISHGATLICGGNKLKNNCFEPTILLDPHKISKVSNEEVFGPVICVYTYSNEDEAIEAANNSPYVFQAAAFTTDLNKALKFSEELNGAAVMINDHTAFRVDWMPFGGQGESGIGLGGIEYSVEEMLKEKLVVIKK